MALIKQSASGANFSSLLAPFTSVATATVRALKDISALELATLREGDIVYVTSIRDYWKWIPTSTATDDSSGAAAQLRYCNPTVNGANPGRFERLFIYSPDWLLQDFTINSATGNNEADGVTTPLANDIELYQRWGANARLTTPRTVTYIQTPTVQSNYDVVLLGGSLSLIGTKTVVLPSVAITAVTAQNRATQTPWDITAVGLGAAHVGLIVQILTSGTPANVGAYAVVVKDLGGGKVRVSPFGTNVISNVSFNVITPIAGDTIEVISLPSLSVGSINIKNGSNLLFTASPLANCMVVDLLTLVGSVNTLNGAGVIFSESVHVFYKRILHSRIRWGGCGSGSGAPQSTLHFLCGGGVTGRGSEAMAGCQVNLDATAILSGATILAPPGSSIVLRKDTIFQASSFEMLASARINSQGTAYFDLVGSALIIASGAEYLQTGVIADWGTGATTWGITVNSTGNYVYVTKPTINAGLGVGRETLIGGTDKLYGAIPYVEGANGAKIALFA